MLAARTPPTSSRSVPTSMLYLRCCSGGLPGGRRTRPQCGSSEATGRCASEPSARSVVEHERGGVGRADRPADVPGDRAAGEQLRFGELVGNLAAAVLESRVRHGRGADGAETVGGLEPIRARRGIGRGHPRDEELPAGVRRIVGIVRVENERRCVRRHRLDLQPPAVAEGNLLAERNGVRARSLRWLRWDLDLRPDDELAILRHLVLQVGEHMVDPGAAIDHVDAGARVEVVVARRGRTACRCRRRRRSCRRSRCRAAPRPSPCRESSSRRRSPREPWQGARRQQATGTRGASSPYTVPPVSTG